MKLYISADIEGIGGITRWDETELGHPLHAHAVERMTAEVKAACEAAQTAGADTILVKDAHDSGYNLRHEDLPRGVRLIRSWAGHPYSMLEQLDRSFDAVAFVGYHSGAGTGGNPLAHTMNTGVSKILLNGEVADESLLHGLLARFLDVPVILLTGDDALCRLAADRFPGIRTVAVKEGIGNSTVNLHPEDVDRMIRDGMQDAIRQLELIRDQQPELPEHFVLEITYHDQKDAYRRGFYPGVTQTDPRTLRFEHDDYLEILRAGHFLF